jgi:hypothetical protein
MKIPEISYLMGISHVAAVKSCYLLSVPNNTMIISAKVHKFYSVSIDLIHTRNV